MDNKLYMNLPQAQEKEKKTSDSKAETIRLLRLSDREAAAAGREALKHLMEMEKD